MFDHAFHSGVNIIWGQNGSGKSTLMDLIRHSLGGEIQERDWTNAAKRCDTTFAEVSINGRPATLRREVRSGRAAMSIFWGDLEAADTSSTEGWKVFPYAASASKLSFSQVLFNALGMPEVLDPHLQSRITMHQVLRAVCVDQRTPYDELLIREDFDSPLIRDAVGDFLLGVYDERLYKDLLKLRRVNEELAAASSEIDALETILAAAESELTVEMVQASLDEAMGNLRRLQEVLYQSAEEDGFGGEVAEEMSDQSARELEALRLQLEKAKHELRSDSERIEILRYEIEDSRAFLDSLTSRIVALEDSERTREILGAASFLYCPACYAPLDREEDGTCIVCRRPLLEQESANLLRLRHQLLMQQGESERLQSRRIEERGQLQERIRRAQARVKDLQARYDSLQGVVVTEAERRRASLHRQSGYLEREIEDLRRQLETVEKLEVLRRQKEQLATVKDQLEKSTRARREKTHSRKQDAVEAISSETLTFLREDLPRERAFEVAEAVTFDFGKNSVAVDGRSNFAASSMVYLRNSFHFALLLAASRLSFLRYPRLLLLDNIEDKGMEVARNHNLQKLVVRKSAEAEVEHQILFSTSHLAADLEASGLVVGHQFTRERQTLSFGD